MDETQGAKLLSQSSAVILCGGRGTRMGSATRHKVCFPIEGTPAVNRTISMLHRLGLKRIVVVVGALASDVIETVGREFLETIFVYQSNQLGTGHAAQIGVNALRNLGFAGPILIMPGDKVIEENVIIAIAERFVRKRADMVFVTGSKKQNPSSGRVVIDRQTKKILGNVEVRDIQRAKILTDLHNLIKKTKSEEITFEQVIKIGKKYIPNTDKLIKALGKIAERFQRTGKLKTQKLLELLSDDAGVINLADRKFSADEIEANSPTVNLSLFYANDEFWHQMLGAIDNDNAQGEYYLTDVITLSATSGWKLCQYKIADPAEVMAYNSPDELVRIEDTLRRKKLYKKLKQASDKQLSISTVTELEKNIFLPAGRWLELFELCPVRLKRLFTEIYGSDKSLHENRRKLFIRTLKCFIRRYGSERKVIIVRAPGRINLMGRHIDHRGGAVNVMAIDRDAIFVASPRSDDSVRLTNIEPRRFPDKQFSIGQLLGQMEWQDWVSFVNSEYVRRILAQSRGDWSNYIKASMLRLQQKFQHVRIMGFDAAVAGDIPMAAGLSSSSSLVVASAEIAVRFNGLDVNPSELVDLCGEGEWFVGSRGGSADHAAIRMGKRGQIAHVKFFPFEVADIYGFPENCRLIIANSGIDANKSTTARDKFNQKVASYEFGFMLLKDRNEQYQHMLEHLRDLNPTRLNCRISKIYELLLTVPEELAASALYDLLSHHHQDDIDRITSSHRPPKKYHLREVLLYGIAECERSRLAPVLLSENKIETFGQLMLISHNGDRVVRFEKVGQQLKPRRYRYDVSDLALNKLSDDLVSQNPQRVLNAQLYMQAGGYRCSTPQIDMMVDMVKDIPGCYGAQLGGAGLGGCIMILVEQSSCQKIVNALKKNYYQPAKISPMIHICQPVAGSSVIRI